MVMTRFAFIMAIDDKTLFWRIENYRAQETSSLTRDDVRGKRRQGKKDDQGDDQEWKQGESRVFLEGFFLGRGRGAHPLHAPPRSVPGKKYSSTFTSFFMVPLTA